MATPAEDKEFDEWCIDLSNELEMPLKRLTPMPAQLAHVFDAHKQIANTQIRSLQSNFIPNKTIKIHYDYIDCGQLNAAASVRNFLGLVGMLPRDLFQRMLAHPNVLTKIGSCQKESNASQFSEGVFADIDELENIRKNAGRSPYPPIPIDPIRQAFAYVCTQYAFDFLVLHELAHIVVGHYESLQTLKSISAIMESIPVGFGKPSRPLRASKNSPSNYGAAANKSSHSRAS